MAQAGCKFIFLCCSASALPDSRRRVLLLVQVTSIPVLSCAAPCELTDSHVSHLDVSTLTALSALASWGWEALLTEPRP